MSDFDIVMIVGSVIICPIMCFFCLPITYWIGHVFWKAWFGVWVINKYAEKAKALGHCVDAYKVPDTFKSVWRGSREERGARRSVDTVYYQDYKYTVNDKDYVTTIVQDDDPVFIEPIKLYWMKNPARATGSRYLIWSEPPVFKIAVFVWLITSILLAVLVIMYAVYGNDALGIMN